MRILPKSLNKKISTLVGLAIIALIILLVGGLLFWKCQLLPKCEIPLIELPFRKLIQIEKRILQSQPKQSTCPDLDSMLYNITQAPDPLDLAEKLGFRIQEDKIQAILVLDHEGTDTSFLQKFEVEITGQHGTLVQAFVPINQLCDLANTEEVLVVRRPAKAVLF